MFVSRQSQLLVLQHFVAFLAESFSLVGLQESFSPLALADFAVFIYVLAGHVALVQLCDLIILHMSSR